MDGAGTSRAAHSTTSRTTHSTTSRASTSVRSPASASSARAKAATPVQRRGPKISRPWWQGPLPIAGTIVTVALLVVLFIVLGGRGGTTASDAQLAPASVVKGVTQVSPDVFAKVGTGGLKNPLTLTHETTVLKGADGKPEILYIGAEYCPYCAAERWSLIVALSRFGTFSNLHLSSSAAAPEVYPNTPTFTFHDATFTSQYLDFQHVEMQTNQPDLVNGYTPLESLTDAQKQIFAKFDAPPYAQQAGGIPFTDIGNQYVAVSAGYLPVVLQERSWQEVADAMSNATAPTTQEIVGNANYLTAAICQITQNQPKDVCTAAPIPQIQQTIAKG